jgi:hypothetical protein
MFVSPEMDLPRVSLIHATYRSQGVSKAVRDKWLALATDPSSVEHCIAFQDDDHEIRQEYEIGSSNAGVTPDLRTRFVATATQISPSAVRNWNAAASISTGQILLGIADDLIPNQGWDDQLWQMIESEKNDLRFWKLKDSRCRDDKSPSRDDILPRHPAMTRRLYEHQGFFFDPRFVSVGCDDQLLCTGLMKGYIRDGRKLKLHHTSGKILRLSGELNCGCKGVQQVQSRSDSQVLIHDDRWKKLSKENMNSMPAGWVALCENSAISGVGTFLLSPQVRGKSLLSVLFMLSASSKVRFRYKIIFSIRFLKTNLRLSISKINVFSK